jgi:endo-1,4-beta-D-glucanase Y
MKAEECRIEEIYRERMKRLLQSRTSTVIGNERLICSGHGTFAAAHINSLITMYLPSHLFHFSGIQQPKEVWSESA